jgi:phosphoribosylglycinamide formyltransferase-1
MKGAHIAIFASGNGTNAERIIQHFLGHQDVEVVAVFTNKAEAGVCQVAQKWNIPVTVFTRDDFYKTGAVNQKLKSAGVSHIVLAGFLWLVPAALIQQYPNKIINIHPALLPKYGGKGMYGMHVHQAVAGAGEKETGITIHLVNENYDEGKYLLQKKVELTGAETPEKIADLVHELEYTYFPPTVDTWLTTHY